MILLAITPFISLYIPRFIAFWPLIIGLGTSCWFLFIKKELFRISRLYYVSAGAISLLCLLSTLWSISPVQSMEDALRVTAMLMFGGLLVSSFKALEFEDFKPYGWLLPVGLSAAALLCAYDLNNDLVIYKIFHGSDRFDLNTSVMNRGIICCVFAFFITLPFIQNLKWKENSKLLLTTITGLTMVVMLTFSQSQSAQLAFALGLIAFFAFPTHWRLSYILLGISLLAAMLATPIIVEFLYESLIDKPQTHIWFQEAYIGNRVEIWNFVMKYTMNNPLYGYGIEATNYVRHFDFKHIYNEKNTVLHPHNFSIQIWMEFGLVGVIIAAGIINTLLYMVYKTEDALARKSLTVLFIVTMLISSMTYGLWQSWWIGELLFIVGLGTFLSNVHQTNLGQSNSSK
jgi:O-antigen ligase